MREREARRRAFKSSGEAFITSSSASGGMKKRRSVLGQMVGNLSGGRVAPWAVSKEADVACIAKKHLLLVSI